MSRRRRIRVTSILTGLAFVALSGLVPAHAAASRSNVDTYDKSWTFASADLSRCVKFRATGSITYDTYIYRGIYYVSNIELSSPKLTANVTGWSPTAGCYTTSATLTKLTMVQHWTGYACDYNPSISVSLPFSVGVSFWPSCGNRNQATFSTTYAVTSSTYTQSNSGSPVDFGYKAYGAKPSSGPCFGVFVSAVAYRGSSSDSYSAGGEVVARQVCLSPVW